MEAAPATPAAAAVKEELAEEAGWCSLGTPAAELRLEWTLPTGQSFRWRRAGDEWVGVIGQRAVRLRQLPDDVQYRVIARGEGASPAEDAAVLSDYFNLQHSLAALAPGWAAACPRFAAVAPHLPGARLLRQDPVECLFQFICSSNNHISRIHGMVERLCRQHGTPLTPASTDASGSAASAACDSEAAATAAAGSPAAGGPADALSLYAFPSLDQLAAASEEQLRADGFGYRAKFIVGSVAQLRAKPEGGAAWLQGLRDVPYEEAAEALCELPGIGPKVAACAALFSLDKLDAIPVDTHVWNIACRYYTPHLRGKSLTKKLHGEVQAAFVSRFGPTAGWAHSILFIAELATTQKAVPALAAASRGGASKRKPGGASSSSDSSGSDGEGEGGDGDGDDWSPAGGKAAKAAVAAPLPDTPPGDEAGAAVAAGKPARRVRRRAP